jgi:hypothetical protein
VFALNNEAVTIIKTGEIEQKKVQKDKKKELSRGFMEEEEDGYERPTPLSKAVLESR